MHSFSPQMKNITDLSLSWTSWHRLLLKIRFSSSIMAKKNTNGSPVQWIWWKQSFETCRKNQTKWKIDVRLSQIKKNRSKLYWKRCQLKRLSGTPKRRFQSPNWRRSRHHHHYRLHWDHGNDNIITLFVCQFVKLECSLSDRTRLIYIGHMLILYLINSQKEI